MSESLLVLIGAEIGPIFLIYLTTKRKGENDVRNLALDRERDEGCRGFCQEVLGLFRACGRGDCRRVHWQVVDLWNTANDCGDCGSCGDTEEMSVKKTIGDFFLDHNDDGDEKRFWGNIFLLCSLVFAFVYGPVPATWETAGGMATIGVGLLWKASSADAKASVTSKQDEGK